MRSPEDIPSPVIDSSGVSDFCRRILLPIAQKQGGHQKDWTEVDYSVQFNGGDALQRLQYNATTIEDEEDVGFSFYIGRTDIYEFDEEWDEAVVKDIFDNIYEFADDDTEDEDEDGISFTVDTEQRGYFSVDHEYRFIYVPYSSHSSASKSLMYSIRDEDGDPLHDEIGYFSGIEMTEILAEDIEALVRFGETIIDPRIAEDDIHAVTVHDLQFVLSGLQQFGLASGRCKPLSSRLMKKYFLEQG
jgi:hypothetical protein